MNLLVMVERGNEKSLMVDVDLSLLKILER